MGSTDTMLERWKLDASGWKAFNLSAKAQYSRALSLQMLEREMDLRGKSGFDFGCGEGLFTDMLRAKGARVQGCDIDPALVRTDDPDVWVGSVETLSRIASNSLDFFIDRNVLFLYNVSDADRELGLKEAFRTLKPGGLFLTVLGNSNATPAKNKPRDPETFHRELAGYGLREIAQDFYKIYWPGPLKFLPTMNPLVLRMMPKSFKRRRCSAMVSLSRKV